METNIYERLDKLGLAVPKAPVKGGVYSPCKAFGDGLYLCVRLWSFYCRKR